MHGKAVLDQQQQHQRARASRHRDELWESVGGDADQRRVHQHRKQHQQLHDGIGGYAL